MRRKDCIQISYAVAEHDPPRLLSYSMVSNPARQDASRAAGAALELHQAAKQYDRSSVRALWTRGTVSLEELAERYWNTHHVPIIDCGRPLQDLSCLNWRVRSVSFDL